MPAVPRARFRLLDSCGPTPSGGGGGGGGGGDDEPTLHHDKIKPRQK
jgi:hypothetical protein